MNVYLDIDGVLLANEQHLAHGAEEFIKYVVSKYPTYWLSTHCMDGDPSLALMNVGKLCTTETLQLLKQIKPTTWKKAKTEAIDFETPFLWFDDDLYPDEREELINHGTFDSWVEVDLFKRSNDLELLIQEFPTLESKIKV